MGLKNNLQREGREGVEDKDKETAVKYKDALGRLNNGKATPNQLRREFGYPERDGGDELLILMKDVKKKAPNEREQEIREGIDCLMQHLKIFYEQTHKERIADFMDACMTCEDASKCGYDWQKPLDTFNSISKVKLSLVYQER